MNVSCNDIIKKYEGTIIDIKNVEIKSGSITYLNGKNGIGKTTLLHIIAGLIEKDSGTITYNQEYFSKNILRKLSLVYQEAYMMDKNVAENIGYPLKIRGYKKDDINNMVKKYSKMFLVDSLLNKNAKKLSGGEKQKVALARALIYSPKLLLLDEATSCIDEKSLEIVEENLIDFVKDGGTICMVSHDLVHANRICSEIIQLK